MVSKIIRKWLGIDEILAVLKDVPSVVMLQAAEANQKRRHQEILAALSEKQLTSSPLKPKIEPKPHRANWRTFRSLAEKASEEQEQA
jgi:hypothetical protein